MFKLSLVVCCILAAASATDVNQCSGQSFEGLRDAVHLIPCKKIPCKLKKGTSQNVVMKFTPDQDYESISNEVGATIAGVYLPFFGVTGTSSCSKLETEDGQTASCPIKAGTTYVYKDSFPILSIYPSTDLQVHWALVSGDKKLICFEVPAKIV